MAFNSEGRVPVKEFSAIDNSVRAVSIPSSDGS